MNSTHVIGVDPGLVHTGVVRLVFDRVNTTVTVEHKAIVGPNAYAAGQWIMRSNGHGVLPSPATFVEGYRPRSHFGSDERMVTAVSEFRKELNATVLLNHGVKKVVRQPLMELVGCWNFSTVTHHQDLRAAARIALFGMLKDDQLNRLLTDIVLAQLNGRPWRVHS